MSTPDSRHNDPLALKFRGFERDSDQAQFSAFEHIENVRNSRNHILFSALIFILLLSLSSSVIYDILVKTNFFYSEKAGTTVVDASPDTYINQPDHNQTNRETPNGSGNIVASDQAEELIESFEKEPADVRLQPDGVPLSSRDTDGVQEVERDEYPTLKWSYEKNNLYSANRSFETELPLDLILPSISIGTEPEEEPIQLEPKSMGRMGFDRFEPSITVLYGVHRTRQLFSPASANADQYVAAGFLDENRKAMRRSYQSWFSVRYDKMLFGRNSLSLGMGYYNSGVEGRYQFERDSFPVYDIDGTIAGYAHVNDSLKEVVNSSAERKFTYLRIPVGFRSRYPIGHRWNLSVGLDASLDILLRAQGHVLDEQNMTSVLSVRDLKTRPLNVSLNVNTALTYSITSTWQLGLQVDLNKNLLSNFTDTYYRQRNAGFGLGIVSRFQL